MQLGPFCVCDKNYCRIKMRWRCGKKSGAASVWQLAAPSAISHFFILPTMPLLPAFLLDSLDEVVFEGRNQAYGAYQLRHDYQRNLASAGGITLLLFTFLLLSWAAWRQLAPTTTPIVSLTHMIEPILPPASVVIEHPKVAEPQLPHARSVATHPAPTTSNEIIKDDIPQP